MQAFFLCWMLDKRWLFSLANPCLEFIFIVPVVVNLVTIGGMVYERSLVKVDADTLYILLTTLYVFIAVLSLLLITRTYLLSEEKLRDTRENYQAIRLFIHDYEGKKAVWSWIGLCITTLSIIQMIISHQYINGNSRVYGCFTNQTRFYIDVIGWGYIGLVVVLFLIFKLTFLLFAWRHPEKYLRFKEVI